MAGNYIMNTFIGTKPHLHNADRRDQASVLVQIGLLEKGNLPIAGVETAMKVKNEKIIPSNQLIPKWNQKT